MAPSQAMSEVKRPRRPSEPLKPSHRPAQIFGPNNHSEPLSHGCKTAHPQEQQHLSRQVVKQEHLSPQVVKQEHLSPQVVKQEEDSQTLSATCPTTGIKLSPSQTSGDFVKPSQTIDRKRKRSQSEQADPRYWGEDSEVKLRRTSAIDPSPESSASSGIVLATHPVDYWRRNNAWPPEYFVPDFGMSQPLTRKRSLTSLHQEQQSTQGTPELSQTNREAKSTPYKDAGYEIKLANNGCFMKANPVKINDDSKILCQTLLNTEQPTPKDSLFHDDRFERLCSMIESENEARIIQDITRLIVPSAETLYLYGATELDILIEKVNSSWLKCLPLTQTRPQPDYSVGFRASAFTDDQLNRLSPFVGGHKDQCSVMARWDMYFPFLTAEVKCGDQALSIADRQNMHSASVAVKGIVELFKRVERQKELHRSILAFSVSHDNESVRIYGHYSLIDGNVASFHRHLIRKFDITDQDGKERWTAYKFTRNVYDKFVPIHLKRICSVIDQLPDKIDFKVQSNISFVSDPERPAWNEQDNDDTAASSSANADSIAETPASSQTTEPVFKKPKPKTKV